MTTRTRPTAALVATAALAAFVLLCAQALAAQAAPRNGLAAAAVRLHDARRLPRAGARARRMPGAAARRPRPRRPARTPTRSAVASASRRARRRRRAAGDFGLRPQDLHSAYQLPTSASGTQTIALVDAYNDLSAEADLETYDTEFGLPKCTAANGCFTKVNQNGEAANLPFPQSRRA